MSRLIPKKWRPLEDIEAKDLKFCIGPFFHLKVGILAEIGILLHYSAPLFHYNNSEFQFN